MVQTLVRFNKAIAWLLVTLFYCQLILIPVAANASAKSNKYDYAFARIRNAAGTKNVKPPALFLRPQQPAAKTVTEEFIKISAPDSTSAEKEKKKTFAIGPTQPEMASFQSVNANNLVDLFSGDFSYNIPLLDVGGYPVNLHYQSGITMDQEASWVGLGWNINPGVISRNMRGVPDDFKGTDKVAKILSVKPNVTYGLTAGADVELVGFPLGFQASAGIFYNSYKGWGTELGINAAINSGAAAKGPLTGNLGLTNNSQSGFDVSPSIGFRLGKEDGKTKGNITIGSNFNSRLGIQELQMTGSVKQTLAAEKKTRYSIGTSLAAGISFSKPSFTPTISIPYTTSQKAFTIKLGGEAWGLHLSGFQKGYMSEQKIAPEDTLSELPAYGYLNYQEAGSNSNVLLDFNREKDVSYSNNSPHIAVPMYTYDTWSISGEGTGGMFRAYRGDIGAVFDHNMTTKSNNSKFSIDIGFGSIVHGGVDFSDAYSITSSNPWISANSMYDVTRFRASDTTFENVYFKNPGEKTSVNRRYLDAIGNDSLMRVVLTPVGDGQNDPDASATRNMALFSGGKNVGVKTISTGVVRKEREKRTQLISYLTATEAKTAGLDKVIRSYGINQFPNGSCNGYTTLDRALEKRQGHHISEISVLNEDGRRYVYGVPVYNIKQMDVTMSVGVGDNNTGLVNYIPGVENSTQNRTGKDGYFNKEVVPAYAHSYLLSGILSPDYVDLTGDGITEDDQGDAVKFNYSRTFSMDNPYRWRAPFYENTAFYNEGTKTDNRDERGSYSYGEREVWMLNSIESKTMIATFVLDNSRLDGNGVDNEDGKPSSVQKLHRLKEINLYAKADWLKNGATARPIKTVHFAYSYNLCKGAPGTADAQLGKLTLDSVWFTYNKRGKAVKNAYKFTYHPANPYYDNKMTDRWGVYKPSTGNPGTTNGSLSNADYSYSLQKGNGNWNKDSADKYVAAWTLSEIKLPSGGKVKVSYESDDYAYVQNKRAMQFFKLEGFGAGAGINDKRNNLYPAQTVGRDYDYVFVRVSEPAGSIGEIKSKYLEGVDKLFFKLMVKMPDDPGHFGSGSEIIPCYAEFDEIYRYSNDPTLICFRLRPIKSGESAAGTAAIQYLRQNHPHKAYPYSEPGDNLDIRTVLGMIGSFGSNLSDMVNGFGKHARQGNKCNELTLDKSFVRLNNPDYRKFGGGLRVKKVEVFDNWNKMSGDKEAVYGQEYNYTTTVEIDGQPKEISSGVASYEPSIGNDENPFHVPFKLYTEKVGALAPTDYLYTEEPFAETFFPAPSVGYSNVSVQSIHKTKKSANGITQTEFYTTKDFPTIVELTPLDKESKKTYNPTIRNFLRVDAMNYVTISQGFKVELNDMNGKVKSTITYSQNDLKNPISYTYNYYRLEQDNASRKRISNKVAVINDASGMVDENGEIGKEVEIMVDIREQTSVSGSASLEANADFVHPFPPIVLGSAIPIPTRETNRFRSIAVLKVVNRYGILDSVVVIEKGSKISTRNLVFDGETGSPLVTRTNNMFEDPVFSLSLPAHWAYSGMGSAYKNQGTVLANLQLRRGILFKDGVEVDMSRFFESGDEILVRGKHKRASGAGSDPCSSDYYVFDPAVTDSIVWAIHGEKTIEKEKGIYFIDRRGYPVTAQVDLMKIVRSGKRNIGSTAIGNITSMASPVRGNKIVIDDTTKVLNSQAVRFKDNWKVEKVLRQYDSCVMEKNSGTATIPFTNALMLWVRATDEYKTTSYGNAMMAAAYRHYNRDVFIARSVLRLNMASIPSNAIINNAYLDLSSRAPYMLFGVPPDTDYDLNYSYEGEEEQTIGYIVPFKENVPQGADLPWVGDYALNALPNKAIVPFRGNGNYCADYKGIQLNNVIQELVGLPSNMQNILLKLNTEDNTNGSQETRFMCFYGGGPASQNFIQSTVTPFASGGCNQGGNVSNCHLSTCPSSLYVEYDYYMNTCYKVCRQEYLQKDTLNPYVVGILGNWRIDTSYVYYSDRKESAVSTETNIRTDGLIKDFASYWIMGGKYLTARPDPSRWVWNSKTTLHNRKGLELENKDPLDRYNAVIYGFNKTLPVATAQNARLSEFTFDGFEDQKYQTDKCLECFESGWMKIDAANGRRTELQSHSGKNSLEVYTNKKMEMSIPLSITAPDDAAKTSFRRDSIMRVTTTITPNGYGLTGQSGVWLAIPPVLNPCVGRYINSLEWWPQTFFTNINANYGQYPPPGVCADNYFAVQYYGVLLIEQSGYYVFRPDFDDYMKISINGNDTIVQENGDNPEDIGIYLNQGFVPIWAQLTEEAGDAFMQLQWQRPGSSYFENIPLVNQYGSMAIANNSAAIKKDTTWCVSLTPVKRINGITESFSPIQGTQMVVSGWVKQEACNNATGYPNAGVNISFTGSSTGYTLRPSGKVIDGWQRIEEVIIIPQGASSMKYELVSGSSGSTFFDDLRIHPFHTNMKSFSYDPVNLRLMAEMDENNYATFYEYDDEGTLVRVKKETERGVKTIKETRSALTKKENL
ncbi:MAG: hypothetical protein J7578_12885 [Chitinophagaceae bacterium]|nr:hypothetical protein [Chitinophagaceae bacterium]